LILAAGLTPAWQHVLVFGTFRYGEVNRAREVHRCASGKVFNAGIAAHLLGGPSLTLATVGGRPVGEIEDDFRGLGAPFRWVLTQSPTRVCTTLLDRAAGQITELVENGAPLIEGELKAFLAAYTEEAARADVAILIGSLPQGTRPTYYRELVERTPCPMVLDFRGEGLLSVLDLKPQVVKPNREELGYTVPRPPATDTELREAMQSLNRRGARYVVVTQGAGPTWVTTESEAWRVFPLPAGEVVNPIGCGDVLAASIAWSIRAGRDVLEGVRLGAAAAEANLRNLLPGRFDPKGVHERAKNVRVEKVAG
jgi:1-phosphofructokinase family hexose kinase